MPSPLGVIIIVLVIAFIVWLIGQITMPTAIRNGLYIAILIVVVLYLLRLLRLYHF